MMRSMSAAQRLEGRIVEMLAHALGELLARQRDIGHFLANLDIRHDGSAPRSTKDISPGGANGFARPQNAQGSLPSSFSTASASWKAWLPAGTPQ